MAAILKTLNSFEIAARFASIICFILFISWQFLPNLLFFIFGLENGEIGYFLGQRIAALFIALALILYFLANEKGQKIQKVISISFALACFLLAISGIFAYLKNIAGIGIMIAIIVELFFCFWFLFVTRQIKFSILYKQINE